MHFATCLHPLDKRPLRTGFRGIVPLSAAVVLLMTQAGTALAGNPLPPVYAQQTAGHSGPQFGPDLAGSAASVRITKRPGTEDAASVRITKRPGSTAADPQRLPTPPAEDSSAASVRVTKKPNADPVITHNGPAPAPAVLRIQSDQRDDMQTQPLANKSLPTLTSDRNNPTVVSSAPGRFAPISAPNTSDNDEPVGRPGLLDVNRAFDPNRETLKATKSPQLASEAIRLLQEASESANTSNNQPRPLNEEDRFGQAPADADNRQVFLRTETVLLTPGEYAFDFGLRYIWREFEFPIVLPPDVLTEQRIRSRQLFMPFQLRYGLFENAQLFVDVPVGGSVFETSHFASDFYTSKFGLGDVTAGISYQCQAETDDSPAVILTASMIAPTGDDPFAPTTIGFSDQSSLGSGFWGAGAGLLFTKTYDPLVVFGGFGYLHRFDRSYLGIDFDPGHVVTYQFGAGFAVNDVMTLSTTFLGAFETTTKGDGVSISNSSQEPFTIRLALTHVRNPCCIIEPFVAFGLNQDAPNADFGIIMTRR